MVNTLVNLQDPILKTSKNLATPANASVGLQDLEEPILAASDVGHSLQELIVALSAFSPSLERARLQEPIVASLAITPPPERMRPQEPIITSSAVIAPPPEQVCFITESFASSFPCAALILCLLSGFEPLRVTFIRPCIRRLGHTRSHDHQQDLTGISSQLLYMKGLLSAPIDALVQDSDAVRQILEEIKSQLWKSFRSSSGRSGTSLSSGQG
jgi:hypothetical protein